MRQLLLFPLLLAFVATPPSIHAQRAVGRWDLGENNPGAMNGRFDGFVDDRVIEDLILPPPSGVVADIGADFQPNAPRAGWSYLGSTAASGGIETSLTYGGPVGNNGNIGYGGGANTFNLGAVLGTNTGANAFKMFVDGQFNAGVAGTDLLVHPGDPVQLNGGGRPFVILRYTLGAADLLHGNLALVSGSFRELIPGGDGVEAYIFHNATELFHVVAEADTLPQAAGTFNVQALVSAGDTLRFVVGIKGNLYGDESAVRGTITLTSDTTPPALTGPPAQVDVTRLTVTFNELVQAALGNFALNNGATISALVPGATANSFDLVTTPLVAGQAYTLSIAGVTDLSTNSLTTNATFTAADFSPNLPAYLRPPPEPIGPATRRGPFVISEIMFHPRNPIAAAQLEFVELHNSQPWAEDIGGFRLTGEYDFTLPAGTTLPAGGYLVVAPSPPDITAAYGITNVAGGFTNKLNNVGGTLRLLDDHGAVVFEVDYATQPPWPASPDGAGHSLVLARPSYGMNDVRAWSPSRDLGGSPGAAEPSAPTNLSVVVNEFLAHGDTDPDFVELFNFSAQPVSLAGCSLSDDASTNKFVLAPDTIIPPRGFLAFDETQLGFSLSADGETIWFRDAAGRVLDAVRFAGQAGGVTTGRTPDGSPLFSRLGTRTPGTTNAPARRPDVVLNEIFFSPPGDDGEAEFVELKNRTTHAVNVGGWRLRGGVSFTLPAGRMIPPGGYLVVAKNVTRVLSDHPGLGASSVVGPCNGNLANGGERIALEAPESDGTNTLHYLVSEVSFGHGGRWGRWSDEGGSSLELIDADADPRLAPNWADSDSSTGSGWKTIEFTGTIDHGQGTPDRLQILLAGAGECLVDDLEVLLAGNAANRLANPGFESGTNGWSFQGTHRLSTVDNTGGVTGPKVLHLRATGRGDTGPNKVQAALTSAFSSGQTATIRAKVRWLAGHPDILFRLRGSWLEAHGSTRTFADFGTPGRANSRAVPNAGPALTEVTHLPVLPAAFRPVTVYARVADPHGLGRVELNYRIDPSAVVVPVPMEALGAGVYAGRIPGQASGTLAAFYLTATDAPGSQASFPNDAPARECLVRWGESRLAGNLGTYRLWFTQTNRTRWESREPQSNEPLDSTFVYGDARVIYNAGVMYSGSPFHTPLNTGPMGVPCDYQLVMPADDAMLGETDLILAPPGSPWGTDLSLLDYTLVREQVIWWIARQLGVPSIHRRFVQVVVNGQWRTTVFEDTQQPAGEFLRQWFPDHAGGQLFKAQDWLEFPDTGNSFLSDVRATLEKFTTPDGALPPKRYRWTWAPRAVQGSVHDFTNFFTLIETMALADGPLFGTQVDARIDIESWFRAMAVQRIAGNWDTWGWTFGKNMYAYLPPGGRWAMVPWDIDFSLGLNSSATDADILSNANGGGQPGDPIATKLRNHPMLQRAYWRAFEDAVNGPMTDSRVAARIDAIQAALVANGRAPASPAGVKSWISARRTYLRGQLTARTNAAFTVTFNGGNDLTTNAQVIRLTGTAPVSAKTILFNGIAYPVLWTTVTNWSIVVPLVPGANPVAVTGLDRGGSTLSNLVDSITITSTAPPVSPVGNVVINEIMYNPSAPDAAFVELFNRSPHTFDLGGWELDGAGLTFPAGTVMTNGQHLLVANDRGAMGNAYGAGPLVTAEFRGSLSNDGEVLSLRQPAGSNTPPLVVDRVRYEPVAPWGTVANGGGPSLQLLDPAQDNARVSNWSDGRGWRFASLTGFLQTNSTNIILFTSGSGGEVYLDDITLVAGAVPAVGPNLLANGDFESPLSGSWSFVGTNQTNSALATNRAHGGTASLRLVGTASGSQNQCLRQFITPPAVSNQYTISFWYLSSTNGTNVQIRSISGIGVSLLVNFRPPAPATPGTTNSVTAPVSAYPTVWLNEVRPGPSGGRRDQEGEFEPWLELYNSGSSPVSLEGCFLSEGYLLLNPWAFPTGALLNPGEFKVIVVDGEPDESTTNEWHTSFRLEGGSGSLALAQDTGAGLRLLDYFNYAAVPHDQSYGSVPDGQPFYRGVMFYPTAGATNDGRAAPLRVFINEWMAVNTGASGFADPADGDDDDWFELFNPGPAAVDLGGSYLTDNLTNPLQYQVPNNGHYTIPAGGYLLVWADGEAEQNNTNQADLHVSFSLRAAGEAIGLFAADGTLIDAVSFTNQTANVSQGRSPDGGGTIVLLPTPSPRAANVSAPAAPIITRIEVEGVTVTLTFSTVAGRSYQVEYKDDLGAVTWMPLGGVLTADGSVATRIDTNNGTQRFYRVGVVP